MCVGTAGGDAETGGDGDAAGASVGVRELSSGVLAYRNERPSTNATQSAARPRKMHRSHGRVPLLQQFRLVTLRQNVHFKDPWRRPRSAVAVVTAAAVPSFAAHAADAVCEMACAASRNVVYHMAGA